MNNRPRNLIIFAAIILASFAASSRAQTVSGSLERGTVERGKTARGVIVMSIPNGLHVNSYRPSSEYSIPTTVRLSSVGTRVGAVNYPRGTDRKFEFSNDLINVYEGTVRFPFTITVPSTFRGDTVRVRAVVRYQACTNEVCYPPRSKDITITARLR